MAREVYEARPERVQAEQWDGTPAHALAMGLTRVMRRGEWRYYAPLHDGAGSAPIRPGQWYVRHRTGEREVVGAVEFGARFVLPG